MSQDECGYIVTMKENAIVMECGVVNEWPTAPPKAIVFALLEAASVGNVRTSLGSGIAIKSGDLCYLAFAPVMLCESAALQCIAMIARGQLTNVNGWWFGAFARDLFETIITADTAIINAVKECPVGCHPAVLVYGKSFMVMQSDYKVMSLERLFGSVSGDQPS